VRTGKEVCRLAGHRSAVTGLTFSSDGRVLAAKGSDGTVVLWEAATGKELRRAAGSPNLAGDLSFSPDGKVLALGKDTSVALLDVSTGKVLRRLRGPTFPVHAITFSRGGRMVAAAAGTSIHLWEASSGKALRRIDLGESAVGSLAFAPDGRTLAAVGTGSVIRLWDTRTGKELHVREGHRGEVRSVTFSPDGRLIATAGADSTVRLWEARTGREVRVCRGRRLTVDRALFSADGKALFACAANHPVHEWDVGMGTLRRRLEVRTEKPSLLQVHALALAPAGTTLRAVVRARSAREEAELLVTWDLRTARHRIERLPPLPGPAFPSELSPDGRLLARFAGPAVHVRDAAGKELLTLRVPGVAVANVAFSHDNRTAAAVSLGRAADKQVRTLVVWELATGRELLRTDLGDPVMSYGSPLAFAPTGRILAAGGDDPAVPIRLWDLATGREVLRLGGQRGSVTSLAFAPDGSRLAGGLRNGTALVWDVTSARKGAGGLPRMLTAGQLEGLWADLSDGKAARGYAALWTLAASPEKAVALIRTRVKPAAAVGAKDLARLVADLDSASFARREGAARELAKLGLQAEGALRRALADRPSAELRRRAKALLAAPASPEVLRRVRAIQLLEAIGSKGARQVLETLAGGAPAARRTREAKAALERLSPR
jgi:WD40 repeat protein